MAARRRRGSRFGAGFLALGAAVLLAGCGAAGGRGAGAPTAAAGAAGTATAGRASTAGPSAPGGASGAAASALPASGPTGTSSGSAAAAGAPVTGTFVIDDSLSTASYTAHETFLGTNSPFTPVGTTSAISGDIILKNGLVQASTVTVDLRTLSTGNSMRDHHIQSQPLQTATYPDAVFAADASPPSGPIVRQGAAVNVPVAGTMTIHGTGKPLTFSTDIRVAGGTLTLTGAASFDFSYFGLQPPDIPGFVAVQEGLALALQITAKAGG